MERDREADDAGADDGDLDATVRYVGHVASVATRTRVRKASAPERVVTLETARRLAVSAQLLAGPRPPATVDGILDVVRRLGRLQLDPTSIVARSHLLVLWSRLGSYDPGDLDTLLWERRDLFEHRAYVVPTDEYPYYRARMRDFPAGDSKRSRDIRAWMAANAALRRSILARCAARAAAPARPRRLGAGRLALVRLERRAQRRADARLPARPGARARHPAGGRASRLGSRRARPPADVRARPPSAPATRSCTPSSAGCARARPPRRGSCRGPPATGTRASSSTGSRAQSPCASTG